MTSDRAIRLRRTGQRRTWPWFRMRPEYQLVISVGDAEVYRGKTLLPSAVLVRKGEVHSTDSYDWVRAADEAYERDDARWISDPFAG